jgi:moderate conductance mechanosensitive channel
VVRALRRAGIVSSEGNAPMVAALPHPAETQAVEEAEAQQAERAPEHKQ